MQRHVIAARAFGRTGIEIEMAHFLQNGQTFAERRIEPCEAVDGTFDQFVDLPERAEWRLAAPVDGEVPRTQGVLPELTASVPIEFFLERQDRFFDGFVKVEAILHGVIETAQTAEFVVAIIVETGVPPHLVTELNEIFEQLFQLVGILPDALIDLAIDPFPHAAIGLFQKGASLLQGKVLLTVPNGHVGKDRAVLLGLELNVGLQRYVFLPEELDILAHFAQIDRKAVGIEPVGKRRFDQLPVEGIFSNGKFGRDLLDRFLIVPDRLFIGSVDRHGDIAPGQFFAYHGLQFAAIEDPTAKVFRSGEEAILQLLEIGLHGSPIGQCEFGRQVFPGPGRRYGNNRHI